MVKKCYSSHTFKVKSQQQFSRFVTSMIVLLLLVEIDLQVSLAILGYYVQKKFGIRE